MNIELLRRSPLLAGLSDETLLALAAVSEIVTVEAGEVLIEQGLAADSAYLVLEGEFVVQMQTRQGDVFVGTRGPGDMLGEMALLERGTRNATVQAAASSRALRIPQEGFERLITSNPRALRAVLVTVLGRLRENDALLRHQDKMAALGTLSAGIAHELNNPAAAMQRSAEQMKDLVRDLQALAHQVSLGAAAAGKLGWLAALNREILRRVEASLAAESEDVLARLERRERLAEWLEAHGIAEAWENASDLAAIGWEPADLDEWLKPLDARLAAAGLPGVEARLDAPLALGYISRACALFGMLNEIRMGAERISEIVRAMKSYTYLDQAPVQEVDIHEGLENTLVILRHKLKQGVTIQREFAPGLPLVEAYAGELNQVWTNLIANAAEAMQSSGEISLRTWAEEGRVHVEIGDNGPGIPPAQLERIFEPFYTTKGPGQGTGLGLHIAHNIVRKHGGEIQVRSRPGETVFRVSLPLRIQRI